jgi:hypothetical protein
MRKLITVGLVSLLLAAAGRVDAYQQLLPLNTATSTLQTQMKVTLGTTSTSTDTVPVSGFLLLDLDTNGVPASISLRNFDIHALRNLRFTNTILIFSKLYTTVTNLQVFDGRPGPQEPYFPVTAGGYTLTNVPFRLKGVASYTGVASGTSVLDSSRSQDLSSMSGTWQVLNGTNYAHVDFTFAFAEITITNALGTVKVNISGAGSLNAQAPVNAPPPPAPVLASDAAAGRFVIRWPSSLWPTPAATNTPAGYWLYRTTDLAAPAGWEREPVLVNDDGTWSTVDVPMETTQRFYRLDWK